MVSDALCFVVGVVFGMAAFRAFWWLEGNMFLLVYGDESGALRAVDFATELQLLAYVEEELPAGLAPVQGITVQRGNMAGKSFVVEGRVRCLDKVRVPAYQLNGGNHDD